eukprot:1211855-Pleurochrysis_carterae.AAC.1
MDRPSAASVVPLTKLGPGTTVLLFRTRSTLRSEPSPYRARHNTLGRALASHLAAKRAKWLTRRPRVQTHAR